MKSFVIIWLGELVSILGTGLSSFALGVYIFQKTGQATPFALTVLFGNLPMVLLLPLAGSLADRFNRRLIMILADTGAMLVTLAAVLVFFFAELQTWHIYLISFMGAVFSSFQEPAYMASISMLVPAKELTRANGMLQSSQAMQSLATPLIAGALFPLIGLQGLFAIDFISFFFAVGALMIVRIPQPARQAEVLNAQSGFVNLLFADINFAWNYLKARPGLKIMLYYFSMVNFTVNFAGVLMGPMVLARYSITTFGFIEAVHGAGMLLGGIVISIWGGSGIKRRVPVVFGALGLGMLAVSLTGLRPDPFFVAAGLFIFLFFIPIASGLSQAIWQVKVPRDLQGRVFSLRSMISRAMMPLAFISAGPAADLVFEPLMRPGGALANSYIAALIGSGPGRGIGLIFVLAGVLGVLITIGVYANPHLRHLEEELPDAIPAVEG